MTAPLPTFSWRPLTPNDAPAMHQLMLSAHTWGGFSVEPLADVQTAFADGLDLSRCTTAVCTASGQLVAFAWIYEPSPEQPEYRIDFWWQIDPRFNSLALREALLNWLETAAMAALQRLPADDKPRWMTGWCYDDEQALIDLYQLHGYWQSHAEVFMRRDLSALIPEPLRPPGVTLLPWTVERSELMRQAFNDGFRDRWPPGYTGVSAAAWQRDYIETAVFKPEISYIALKDERVVGMTRILVNDEENGRSSYPEGEIGHIAVVPEYRRQGIASLLLYQAMHDFKQRDLHYAMLTVDVKNQRAIQTYTAVGFVTSKRYLRFRKDLNFHYNGG